jgi:hypothetical protein
LPSFFGSPLKLIFPFACRLPSGRQFLIEQPGSQQAEHAMSMTLNSSSEIPWWKEPSKEQWKAWIAAWLGWTLDAFDFTIFLLSGRPHHDATYCAGRIQISCSFIDVIAILI